ANLEQVMTPAAYAHMLPLAKRLADGFRTLIGKHDLKWSVTELGARSEFQFCPVSPKTGAEAEAAFHDELQMALHLYLINRGILITPFHNMTLCCPSTTAEDVDRLIATLDEALSELLAIPGARESTVGWMTLFSSTTPTIPVDGQSAIHPKPLPRWKSLRGCPPYERLHDAICRSARSPRFSATASRGAQHRADADRRQRHPARQAAAPRRAAGHLRERPAAAQFDPGADHPGRGRGRERPGLGSGRRRLLDLPHPRQPDPAALACGAHRPATGQHASDRGPAGHPW